MLLKGLLGGSVCSSTRTLIRSTTNRWTRWKRSRSALEISKKVPSPTHYNPPSNSSQTNEDAREGKHQQRVAHPSAHRSALRNDATASPILSGL